MNILLLIFLNFFFIEEGVYFPLKNASQNLNPGFCIEIGKNIKKANICLSFKNFSFSKNSQMNFSIFSIFGDIFYEISKNFFISFGPSLSLLSIQKGNKREFGTTVSLRSFLSLSYSQRFVSGLGFEFIKGKSKNIFLIGMKLGFIWD